MSNATQESYYKSLLGLHVNYIRDFKLDDVEVDPTTADEERELKWVNPDKRLKVNVGTGKVETVAWLSDLTGFWRNRGSYTVDGVLPTANDATIVVGEAVAPYDTFLITSTTPVTYPGILGDDELNLGDILVFLGGDTPDPTDPAQWVGIQQGPSVPPSSYEIQPLNLTADTPQAVTGAIVTDIKDINIRRTDGLDITSELVVFLNGGTATIQSNTSLANLSVYLHG